MPQYREYDLKNLPNCPVILLIGRRRSGKSVTTLNLMKHYAEKCKFALAFVGSNATVDEFKHHMPSSFIYQDLNFDLLQKLIDRQNEVARTRTPDRVLIVIDDLAYSNFFKSVQIKQLVCNGRHLSITLIITAQYLRVCPPIFRSNVDVVCASQEKSTMYRKALYENFSICFPNFFEFDRTYRALTQNYSMMVLVTASGNPSDLPEDNVHWLKSPFPIPSFKINPTGRWWQLHASRVNPFAGPTSKRGEIKRITLAEQKQQREAIAARKARVQPSRAQEAVEEKTHVYSIGCKDIINVRVSSRFS